MKRKWDVRSVPMYLLPTEVLGPVRWLRSYTHLLEQGWKPIGSGHLATEDTPQGRVGIVFGLLRRRAIAEKAASEAQEEV